MPIVGLRYCQCSFGDSMSGQQDRASKSSSSSISSSTQESEEEAPVRSVTIGSLLAQANSSSGHSLGKRLSHLGSIPYTPRVNGKIPNVDNATLDHERLLERLGTYGLAEFHIEGDGNCQFRALADQIFRNPDYHKHVRKAVMKQLKEFRKQYESYVPMEYKVYLKKMKRSGEWGDHLTLQAAADRFGAKICLLTSFKDTCLIEIVPRDLTPTKELWLSFWCEVHYNSLYGIDDLLTRKAKKKHWLF
ncbi:OTU domain-containing protein DDB_G0284757 isoform X4 [Sorghum bicolor]|uniref:OTU domain-containing protein DDB_G0284757 isoform X4 n=1 Tax=Sorghum bicolor TaxID=4558 RepID=UPI000B424198|nr:OTU domain-containing protein DDB_G0284757 isoform X4 [Sorghum bicolor]|eukprot:XP_021306244.1 OTU domain-containing protein DDB_G0284757 isoform X4 [Sorghum bicolor]